MDAVNKELDKTFLKKKPKASDTAAEDQIETALVNQRKLSFAEEVKDKGADGATFGLFWPEYEQEEREQLKVEPKYEKINKEPDTFKPQEIEVISVELKQDKPVPPPPKPAPPPKAAPPPKPAPPPRAPTPPREPTPPPKAPTPPKPRSRFMRKKSPPLTGEVKFRPINCDNRRSKGFSVQGMCEDFLTDGQVPPKMFFFKY